MKENDGSLIFDTEIKTSGFEKALDSMKKSADDFVGKISEKLGSVLKNGDTFSGAANTAENGIKSLFSRITNAVKSCSPEVCTEAENIVSGAARAANSEAANAKQCGENFAENLQNGILSKTSSVMASVKKWCGSLVDGIKGFLGIHSPSAVMRDEVGKYVSLGVAEGITKNSSSVTDAFKSLLDKLDYQRKFDLISEEEYYEKLESLRNGYLASGTEEWLDYTAKIYDYRKKQLEETKKAYKTAYDGIFDYVSDKVDEVIKKQEEYSKKLKTYGSLFKNVTISLDEGDINYYSLSDLKADTEKIKSYADMMTKLKETLSNSGIPQSAAESFFEEINSLSLDEGVKALEALSRATPKELADYLDAYAERQALADKISATSYGTQMQKAADESTEYMKRVLTEAGFEVPESFFETGTVAAKNFGEAFAKELDGELDKIKIKIDDFNAKLSLSVKSDSEKTASAVYNTYKDYKSTYNINSESGDIYTTLKNLETMRRMTGN